MCDDRRKDRVMVAVKSRGTPAVRPLSVGVLNVRSLGNKSAVILDIIVDNSFDLFVAVETWHDSAESTSVITATSPGYQVFERARPRTAAMATNRLITATSVVFVRYGVYVSVLHLPTYTSRSSCCR